MSQSELTHSVNNIFQDNINDRQLTGGHLQNGRHAGEILYIGYDPVPTRFDNCEEWTYPVVKMPKKNSVIRQPATGARQKKREYTEEGFQRYLETLFSDEVIIFGNARVSTGNRTRPYEPDILLTCPANGKNIFIDVEIDEPYGAITRNGTHLTGEDELRDCYFTDRGWIVVRFAEWQVHAEPERCAGLIMKIFREIAPETGMPEETADLPLPTPVNQWNLLEAQKWEKENFREKYLDHIFTERCISGNGNATLGLTEKDLRVEEKVEKTVRAFGEQALTTGIFNINNQVERDSRIEFYPEEHLYFVDGIHATSVSTLIGRFFPEFDTIRIARKYARKRGMRVSEVIESWNEKGEKAMEAGTYLHLQIENFLNGEDYETPPEFSQFLNFMDEHPELESFRTEWRIFDEGSLVAGTIDYIAANPDGSVSMYDWKRSKKIVGNNGPVTRNPYQSGIGGLSHLDDTSFNRYSLQQCMYKHILENKYNLDIRDMYLVVFHPKYSDFHKVEVPDMSEEIEYILDAV